MTVDNGTVFDRIGADYEKYHEANPAQLESLSLLCQKLNPASLVLDLGCGTGSPAGEFVSERGHQYLGIDSSRVMISAARGKRLGSAVFLRADIRDVAKWTLNADGVIAHFSLLMLPRRDIVGVLVDLRQVLSPGGLLSLAMPEFEGDELPVTFMGEVFPASGYLLDDLVQLLQEAGFEVLSASRHLQSLPDTDAEPQVFVLARNSQRKTFADHHAIPDLLFELGHLKRLNRTGWELSNSTRDNVGSHSFRVALIAALLAVDAGLDPGHAAMHGLLHDLHEARTGDQHHLARRYSYGENTDQVLQDQLDGLPKELKSLINRYADVPHGPMGDAIRDADQLEALLHVRETLQGQPDLMEKWSDYLERRLTLKAGRTLARSICASDPSNWWTKAVAGGEGESQ